jgi:succinoglycan biosynthesis protein ExoM
MSPIAPISAIVPVAVAVGVCTFNRPFQLRRLLAAVAEVASEFGASRRLDVIVVDDGAARRADEVVSASADQFSGELHYHYLGSADVATARNKVLELGTELAPWLVLIDDDCIPESDWLTALFEVQSRTDADVVTGHVQYTTPMSAPRWLREQPFCDFDTYVDGEEPTFGTTANALIRSSFIRDNDIRFRPSLGRTGGEDMTFFHDVREAGGQLRYAAKAVVVEELTPSRQRLSYQLYRQLWLGNNVAEINRHTGQWSRSRLFLRGARWAVRAWADAFRRVARGQRPQLRWTIALNARGVGLVLGVLGVRLRHRA